MVADRHGFIRSCTNALAAMGVRCMAGDIIAPEEPILKAVKDSPLRGAALVAKEVARVVAEAEGRLPPMEFRNSGKAEKPRRPAGCLF